jgi:hypothetical protein
MELLQSNDDWVEKKGTNAPSEERRRNRKDRLTADIEAI